MILSHGLNEVLAPGTPEIFLRPGETYVGDRRVRLRTLLGSCVAITLWHPELRVGGMCHFLLPARLRDPGFSLDGRYGDEAFEMLVAILARRGASARRCEASIAGGGAMFPVAAAAGQINVGWSNGEAARKLLRAQGVAVRRESLYGRGHRMIQFDIDTGAVNVRHTPLPDTTAPLHTGRPRLP